MNNQEDIKKREQMKKQVERSKKYLANNPEARKRKTYQDIKVMQNYLLIPMLIKIIY